MWLGLKNNIIKNKFKKLLSGFSLIELMVVIAIIGVLASIAVPAFDGYVIRSRIAHLLDAAGHAKTAISEYRTTQGSFPASSSIALGVYTSPVDTYIDANASGTPSGSPIYPATCAVAGSRYNFFIRGTNSINSTNRPTILMSATWGAGASDSSVSLAWTCRIVFSTNVPASYGTADCPVSFSAADISTVGAAPSCS